MNYPESNLDLLSASQSGKEVTANNLFGAASPAMMYGNRASTTAGLTWGYYGGHIIAGGVLTQIANGTIELSAGATNYVEADPDTGLVSKNTVEFTDGYLALYEIITSLSGISSYIDRRTLASMVGDTAGSAIAAHEAAADPHPQYLTEEDADLVYVRQSDAQPFDVPAFYPGIPPDNAIVTRIPIARTVTFPAGLTGSRGSVSVSATAQTDFTLIKISGGVSTPVGTIRFAAAATTATFIAASEIVFNAGDVLEIVGQATSDLTLANPGITLVGTR